MVTAPIKKLHNCRYCSEQSGLIMPDDEYAQKQEDGSWKCGKCVFEDLQKRKIRVMGKDHPENKSLIAEEQSKVESHIKVARRLYEIRGTEVLKPKKILI